MTAGKKDLEVEVSVAGRHGTLTAAARARRPGERRAGRHGPDRRAGGQVEDEGERREEAHRRRRSGTPRAGRRSRRPSRRGTPGPGARRQSPRAMFEEDALTAFAASRREVLVFRDPASHHALRFLYRRRDGTLGLVVPE